MAFEHHLGVRVSRKHRDGVTVVCPIREDLLNGGGIVHGGLIASIADEAAWYALRHHFGESRRCTTTELKVNYLRPISGKSLTARAHLLRAGKHLCVSRVDLFGASKVLAAVAVVTYMLLPPAVDAAEK